MAIALDTTTNGGNNGGTGNLTFTHTCTGSNLVLFVVAGTSTGGATATYNGVAMTQQITRQSANYGFIQIFSLLNPATGTNNVVISPGAQNCIGFSASYTGVRQGGFPDVFTSSDFGGPPTSPVTSSVTTTADNCWILAGSFTGGGAGNALSVSTNQTQRQLVTNSLGFNMLMGDTNGSQSPAGSKSMATAFANGPGDVAMGIIAFAPVTASEGYALFL